MKNKKYIIYVMLFINTNVIAQQSLMNAKINDTTSIQKIDSRIAYLEKEYNEYIEIVMSHLKSATLTVEILSFILAAFIAIAGIWNFVIIKKENKKIENKFKSKNQIIDSKIIEIDKKLQDITLMSEKIFSIEKKVTGSQNYTHHGLKNLFDLVQEYADTKNEKPLMEMIFKQKAICDLYSPEENDRFIGITKLIQIGREAELEHLTMIIRNPDESERNKFLAAEAIGQIKAIKNSNQAA